MPVPKYSVWLGQKETFSKDWLSKPGMAQFGLLLSSVTKEVKAFEEATSPMAKRNVALAIQERIADFEKAWKKAYGLAPLPKQLAELQAAAREQVGMNISVHKYDYVSCIAYKVGTAKFDEALFRASWNATLKKYEFPRLVQYAGEQAAKAKAPESFSAQRARMMQADELDYGQRRARMQEAIGKAFELYQSKHGSESSDAKTLKIFMAPEFFFRGFYGAYDVSAVTEIFTALRGFTKDAKFNDWLFVFGTVIAAYFDDQLVCWNCNKMGAAQFNRRNDLTWYCPDCADGGDVAEGRLGARIVNIALIQKGGEDTDRNSYVVDKEYVSHVDFRRHVTAKALSEGKKISGYNNVAKLEPWKSDRQIELLGVTVKALPPDGSRDVGEAHPASLQMGAWAVRFSPSTASKSGLRSVSTIPTAGSVPARGFRFSWRPRQGHLLNNLPAYLTALPSTSTDSATEPATCGPTIQENRRKIPVRSLKIPAAFPAAAKSLSASRIRSPTPEFGARRSSISPYGAWPSDTVEFARASKAE